MINGSKKSSPLWQESIGLAVFRNKARARRDHEQITICNKVKKLL